METLLQTVVTGLLLGGVYGLIATGLSLMFGVMRVINFAHGEFVLIGMYLVHILYTSLGLNPFLSLLVVIPAGMLVGALFERGLIGRLTNAGEVRQLLLTFGLGIVLQGVLQLTFSPNQLSLRGFSWGGTLVQIGPIYIKPSHVVGFLVAVAVTVGFSWMLRHTDLGRQMRAVVADSGMAESAGIRSKRINLIAIAIGSAMALLAGGVLVTYQPVSPAIGHQFLVLAFVAVVLGGLGSITGAFIGGLIAGVVQQFTAAYVAVGLQDVGLFALFILVLIFRPYGLFGRKEVAA